MDIVLPSPRYRVTPGRVVCDHVALDHKGVVMQEFVFQLRLPVYGLRNRVDRPQLAVGRGAFRRAGMVVLASLALLPARA